MTRLKTALAALLLLTLAVPSFAQRPVDPSTLSGTTCPGAACAVIDVSGSATIGIQITGTFVGTLTFEQTNADSPGWVALTLYNVTAPTVGVTSATSTGLFTGAVAGVKRIRVRFSAYTSGSAIVSPVKTLARSWAPSSGGGGGSGDVVGPGSATDNAIVRFDATTGKLLQNSGITIADGASGTLSGTNTGDQFGATLASKLLGRGSAGGTGAAEAITLGTNLSLSGTTLNASGGGGTPGGSDTQIQYNDATAFGGDSTITIQGTPKALVVTNTGSAFGNLAAANETSYIDSATGLSVLQSTASPYSYNSFAVVTRAVAGGSTNAQSAAFDVDIQRAGVSATGQFTQIYSNGFAVNSASANGHLVYLDGSTVSSSQTGYGGAMYPGSGSSGAYNFNSTLDFTGTRTGGNYGFYGAVTAEDGSTTDKYYGFFHHAPTLSGTGAITNFYYFWADSQGVYRIREDATFNGVAQAIPALYNPQFTQYTAGATNFERIVQQWESNVAVMTTEKGGTGTLRDLQLGDAGVHVRVSDLKTTGAATGKSVVCVDTSTGRLYASSTGTDCSN